MVNISANAAAAHRIELVPNCSLTRRVHGCSSAAWRS